MLHDLFQPTDIEFSLPEGQQGPRLWVRRIALWKDPKTLLRDIKLRRGVNIVWSPDLSTSGTDATPHGSGKTTFCRLIRYCLGERHFSNDEQRPLMQFKLPSGFVGAEIIIDDECWIVTRPIGINLPSRAARAESIEETFDQLFVATEPPTIAPIISDRFCASYRNQVPGNLKPEQVWDVLLAWLTRDQECRLNDVLDWRSKRSGSGSPAQELSQETKLTIVRLALGALSVNESKATKEVRNLARERDGLREKLGHLDWFQSQKFTELCESLSFPKDRDPSEEFVRKELVDTANAALSKVMGIEHTKGLKPGDALKAKRRQLEAERNERNNQRAEKNAFLNSLPSLISAARAEQGTEQTRLETGVIVRCTICRVNIDEVKANGCGISLERCDLDEVKKRIDRKEDDIAQYERQERELPKEIEKLNQEIDHLDGEIAKIDDAFSQLAQHASEANKALDEAQKLLRETIWFDQQLAVRTQVSNRLTTIETNIEALREKMGLERERASTAMGDLETHFQQLVANLMPSGCSGRIKFDGKGIHPAILLERGAGLSTAAVESFKIVAFDLAAMILAVNGKAKLPAFLVHDSPREADLDAGIYSNLFDFALGLEGKASSVPFQYIITTTTAPSQITEEHFALRLRLSSTPPEERLFAMDF
ncbi:DUF2326 domain-containing protein [uncultured Cohaesibacter sp.]|uniref:DUF2326 domain-containing protein n=1 Tax=uncultured Cohaesibacter sp. TaxID=1002546 RepID=UPI0029C7AED3|nr:DUF2326 domain-containing protein [uncultured Cohaesibacter sp.]